MRAIPGAVLGGGRWLRSPLPAVALTVLAGVAVAAGLRARCAEERLDVFGGVVRYRSIEHRAFDRHRFVADQVWGLDHQLHEGVVVRYRGVWPDTVCGGTDVVIRGHATGDHIEAAAILGAGTSKYDRCRAWRCRPDRERPAGCRSRFE